ncbi:hypothetical protein Tsubulata_011690 [Turnera subulata]|uniref:Uncharacterized protein n=1 Tax=Turnera subulata TaxID=218843 RepID=A0A9Q0G8A4_9ROSI|nr:hypothetical protein Tsubulata_011690 [Turnera subulata]
MKDCHPKHLMSSPFDMKFSLPKLFIFLLFLLSLICIIYSISFFPSYSSPPVANQFNIQTTPPTENSTTNTVSTNLHHIVFGIAASSKLWNHRKNYIKLWWRPHHMRGIVWLDKQVEDDGDGHTLPSIRISSDTSKFKYRNRHGHRSAIRLSRIVSETFKLGMTDVRWFVMGDDDTMFIPDNLVKVLSKYDHNQYYYIGTSSESHIQNIHFSYGMAYGGGGFAISYPLAKALNKMHDRCIRRYPRLYGSDDRIHACMAELGVPLTKEPGFHQYDVYGNLFGLLAAHPVAPLVSLHHLDLVDPIFPYVDRYEALEKLKIPMMLDSAALMQQSICYDKTREWTVSVSWGYAVQIFQGIISPREIAIPATTFLDWYRTSDPNAHAFNTRPVNMDECQRPFVYTLSNASYNSDTNEIASEYVETDSRQACAWKMEDPAQIKRVEVYKKPDPFLWDKAPRRNCCRILPSDKDATLIVDVGTCRESEVIEL